MAGLRVDDNLRMQGVHAITRTSRSRWKHTGAYPKSWLILTAVLLHAQFVSCHITAGELILSDETTALHDVFLDNLNESVWNEPLPPSLLSFDAMIKTTEFGLPWDDTELASANAYQVLHRMGYGLEYMNDYAPGLQHLQDVMDFRLRQAHAPIDTTIDHCHYLQRNPVVVRRAGETSADLIFDTGASTSFTNDLADFQGDYQRIQEPSSSFTGDSMATARGIVAWNIVDQDGTIRTIETIATYVEHGTRKLFSPQCHFQYQNTLNLPNPTTGYFHVDKNQMEYHDMHGWKLTLPLSPDENLPSSPIHSSGNANQPIETHSEAAHLNILDETNANLTAAQKELLLFHQRLGHMGFQWLQGLLRIKDANDNSYLHSTNDRTKSVAPPRCEACTYANMSRRGTGHHEVHRPDQEMAIRKNDMAPGDCTSMDQYASPIRGRLPNTYGRERPDEQYCGGTLFIDHASSFIQVFHQRTLGATDTLRAKRMFEQEARASGVNIRKYHADNGIFTDREFQEEIDMLGQSLSVSGVGAHHQNGVAERAIQTITNRARAMMLHAALHWPNEAHTNLWPFAMTYAVHLWNRTPNQVTGLSPQEIFCGTKQDAGVLQNAKVWGCPTYVLDPKIQDNHKLPKWKPRSRRGQFLGMSSHHASNIGLIRNLQTGFVSPQYHVVNDEKFTTVARPDDTVDLYRWYDLVNNHRVYYPDEDDLPPALADEWLDAVELQTRNEQREMQNRVIQPAALMPPPVAENHHNLIPDDSPTNTSTPPVNPRDQPEQGEQQGSPDVSAMTDQSATSLSNKGREPEHEIVFETINNDDGDADTEQSMQPTVLFPEDELIHESLQLPEEEASVVAEAPSPHIQPRRNPPRKLKGRNRRYESGYIASLAHGRSLHVGDRQLIFPTMDPIERSISYTSTVRILSFLADVAQNQITGEDTFNHPLSFAAKVEDEDLPTWNMAMNSPDAEAFWTAMDLEIQQLSDKQAWKIVDREFAKQTGQRILGSTWVFRKKRFPDGRLKKIKARICVRGDQQVKGVDVFDTFSPVVQWATVRLMLILSVSMNLCTQQVDYANAFVQAELEQPVYMEMPRGYRQEGKCLELQRSVYGLREAPLNWYNKMCGGLKERGFEPSEHDSCLFVHKEQKMICITWVDDCLFFSYESQPIDDMLTSLKKDFEVDKESDVAGFLGLELKKSDDGTIEVLQTGLIDRIIAGLGLEDANGKATPAEADPIGKDPDGDAREETWSYPSIIGMLLYLQSNSRPDITYAVSQCARFSRDPTRLHEKALKRIGRYLKETRTKGMYIRPTKDLKLDMYCDADFAGLWNHEDMQDPISVKSRTGYITTLGSVPVIWASKLQTEITLSTMEAEYVALSTAMKELIPLRRLLQDILEIFQVNRDNKTVISTVFEDNQSCLILANTPLPRMTPRSKHIAIKYHWFREHVRPDEVEVVKIDTKDQKADIFTKGLRTEMFQTVRNLIMGW